MRGRSDPEKKVPNNPEKQLKESCVQKDFQKSSRKELPLHSLK
jgi:hypothetical protein